MGTSLTDISVSADDSLLSGEHDVGGTHNTVRKGVLASVQVVEFGFCDRVVDIDGGEQKSSILLHGVQSVDSSCSFFGNSVASGGDLVPLISFTRFQKTLDDGEHNLEFCVVGARRVREGSILKEEVLGLLSFVDKKCHVTTVIDDKIRSVSLIIFFGPGEGIQSALPIFFESFSLPREDSSRFITCNGSGCVILSGKDIT
mmetsp:Transcript_16304/g.37722  ORF Transcript_16304/g.37722 Transcript_16304/m.37722 type:complete len:201 (-) Transcript_16304:316-918(-)